MQSQERTKSHDLVKMATPNEAIPQLTDKPKKRKKTGGKKEIKKQRLLSSHVTGPDCKCGGYRFGRSSEGCFEKTTEEEREALVSHFNSLLNKDGQDSYLACLIQVDTVQQRRPGKAIPEERQNPHSFSYKYCVKVSRNSTAVKVPVCFKGFLSMFGITKSRVERIRASLATAGKRKFILLTRPRA